MSRADISAVKRRLARVCDAGQEAAVGLCSGEIRFSAPPPARSSSRLVKAAPPPPPPPPPGPGASAGTAPPTGSRRLCCSAGCFFTTTGKSRKLEKFSRGSLQNHCRSELKSFPETKYQIPKHLNLATHSPFNWNAFQPGREEHEEIVLTLKCHSLRE